jgi:glycosyltransferase involved in cell wall biosynthesis
MLKLSAGFTAVNGFILDQLPKDKPRFLLPGIIDERLEVLGRMRTAPFSHSQRTVGYFGGLAIEKGVQVLLDLVLRLPPKWHLTVSGSGPLAYEFESLGKQYPEQMTFLGRVSETQLYETMCRCDCTVIPREQITDSGVGVFPFKTLEYLVSDTHLIATRLPALQDLDLSFIQRWDGNSADSLLVELVQAESAYKQEQSVRRDAVNMILNRYSFSGVANLFSDLLFTLPHN